MVNNIKLPVGIENFEDMRKRGFYYIDKTGLIEQLVENVGRWEVLQKNLVSFQLEQVYYSYRILILVIILALGMSLVFLILYLVTYRRRKENLIYTAQVIKTQEAERERISNELHDTVCQDLRVLQFQLKDEESVNLCKKIAADAPVFCKSSDAVATFDVPS